MKKIGVDTRTEASKRNTNGKEKWQYASRSQNSKTVRIKQYFSILAFINFPTIYLLLIIKFDAPNLFNEAIFLSAYKQVGTCRNPGV